MQAIISFLSRDEGFNLLSLAAALAFLFFLTTWLSEPRRLINGILFTVFLIILFFWIALISLTSPYEVLRDILDACMLLSVIVILFFVLFFWALFLWNAYFVWKYEQHTLPNLLTLFIGLFLILLWAFALIDPDSFLPRPLEILFSAAPAIALYLLFVMYNFLLNSLLYQLVPRHYHADYLIVLGAGLVHGHHISSLLASRIERALQFAFKQKNKGRKMPKIIMSGGQGPDEELSEAAAMANYAVRRGYEKSLILLEDKSRNTSQNMIFSRQLAEKDYGSDSFKATFFSSSYHIFRAGLYARLADLKANGVGSYTRFYYLPNAVIREFAGVFVMHKKRHIIIIGLIIIFFAAQALMAALGIEKNLFI